MVEKITCYVCGKRRRWYRNIRVMGMWKCICELCDALREAKRGNPFRNQGLSVMNLELLDIHG